MSDEDYRKNHFVPKAYLKGFTNENGKIYRWQQKPDRFKKAIMERSLNQVGYEFDLYTIETDKIFYDFSIPKDEKFIEKNCFKNIENNIGKAIENLCLLNIEEKERRMILDFILISILRNPRMIETYKKNFSTELVEKHLEANKNQILKMQPFFGENQSFVEIKSQIFQMIKERKEYQIDTLAKAYLHHQILDFALNPNSRRHTIFHKNLFRKFTIREAVGKLTFVTTNFPAYSFQNGVGFNNNLMPTSSYILPLNNRYILEIDGKPRNEKFYELPVKQPLTDEGVELINFITMKNSRGEVYCSNKKQLEKYKTKTYQNYCQNKLKSIVGF